MTKLLRQKRKISSISSDFDDDYLCFDTVNDRERDASELSHIQNDIQKRFNVNSSSATGYLTRPLRVDESIGPIKERVLFLETEIEQLTAQLRAAQAANQKDLENKVKSQLDSTRAESDKLKLLLKDKLQLTEKYDPKIDKTITDLQQSIVKTREGLQQAIDLNAVELIAALEERFETQEKDFANLQNDKRKQKKARLFLTADLNHEYIAHLKDMIECLHSLHNVSSELKEGKDKDRHMSVFLDKIEEYKDEIDNIRKYLFAERRQFGDQTIGGIEKALKIAEKNLLESDEQLRQQQKQQRQQRHNMQIKEIEKLEKFVEPFVFNRLFSQLEEFVDMKNQSKNEKLNTPAIRQLTGKKDVQQRVEDKSRELEDNKKEFLRSERASFLKRRQTLRFKQSRLKTVSNLLDKKIQDCLQEHKDLQIKLKTNDNLSPENIVEVAKEISLKRKQYQSVLDDYSKLLMQQERLINEETIQKLRVDEVADAAKQTQLTILDRIQTQLKTLQTRIEQTETIKQQEKLNLDRILSRVHEYSDSITEEEAFFVRANVHTMLYNRLLFKQKEVEILLNNQAENEKCLKEIDQFISETKSQIDALTDAINAI